MRTMGEITDRIQGYRDGKTTFEDWSLGCAKTRFPAPVRMAGKPKDSTSRHEAYLRPPPCLRELLPRS